MRLPRCCDIEKLLVSILFHCCHSVDDVLSAGTADWTRSVTSGGCGDEVRVASMPPIRGHRCACCVCGSIAEAQEDETVTLKQNLCGSLRFSCSYGQRAKAQRDLKRYSDSARGPFGRLCIFTSLAHLPMVTALASSKSPTRNKLAS